MPIYEYECPRCGIFELFRRHYIEPEHRTGWEHYKGRMVEASTLPWLAGCGCGEVATLVPSIFAHPVIGSIVDQSRIDKAPEIEHSKAVKQAAFDHETAKRHVAANQINKAKDRARSTEWKSKTFIPGGGVQTVYPKSLESDV